MAREKTISYLEFAFYFACLGIKEEKSRPQNRGHEQHNTTYLEMFTISCRMLRSAHTRFIFKERRDACSVIRPTRSRFVRTHSTHTRTISAHHFISTISAKLNINFFPRPPFPCLGQSWSSSSSHLSARARARVRQTLDNTCRMSKFQFVSANI